MPLLFLDRVDAAPLANSEFPMLFNNWIGVLVDVLNETITNVQDAFNFLHAPQYTAAEIATFLSNGGLPDGIIFYDTDNNEYVGKISGSLVKFQTTTYP